MLLSRRGSSDDIEDSISWSSSGRGRLDLNRRKSTLLLLLLLLTLDEAAEDVGSRIDADDDEGHLVRAAAVRAAR